MTQNMTYERIAKCSYCRCTSLPVNDAGYCQRCNEGWYGFLNLPSATVGELERELQLVLCALTTEETKGKAGHPALLAKLADDIGRHLRKFYQNSVSAT